MKTKVPAWQRTVILFGCFALGFVHIPSLAQSPDQIKGRWMNPDGDRKIEIYQQDNAYFGKLVWLKKPTDRVKVGTVVLKNITYSDGKWKGITYLPARDQEITTQFTMPDPNSLKISARLGWASQTKTWKRINETGH